MDRLAVERKLKFIRNYVQASNAATGSEVDSNANVTSKNIATMSAELFKPDFIDVNRFIVKDYLAQKFDQALCDLFDADLKHHIIYSHDETSLMPYCVAVSLYPFILNGLKPLGGTSGAPKHCDSFVGGLTNLIFLIAGLFAGAVAVPEMMPYLDHFLRKDYCDDYVDHLDDVVEAFGNRRATLRSKIEDLFQQFVYCVNQPAAARGYQSPFTNIAYFDSGFFNSMFKDFVFPDGDVPNYASTCALQKMFITWFNKERTKDVLTFPVETGNLLHRDGKFVDEDMADFIAKSWSEGHSMFLYTSDSVDALSSCCFSKDQKVLARSCCRGNSKVYFDTFENIGKTSDGPDRAQFEVFHNGSWCHGSKIKLPNRPMYKVTTANSKEIIVSDNHLNPTTRGDVATSSLTTDDYLLFNTRVLESFPEQDLHLTYEQGFAVGAYLGDGNYVTPCSREFVQYWTDWTEETSAATKTLNLECLLLSKEFRQGILAGWHRPDTDDSNSGHTASKDLAESMEVLINSLGMQSVITVADRSEEESYISPIYTVCWYAMKNRRSIEDIYKIVNNSVYFKIKSIEPIEYDDDIYCFEMSNKDEPYFTLPNGIITHNCRLKNAIEQNDFSYTLGAGGVMTGSKKVITLNINRIVQDWYNTAKDTETLSDYVARIVNRVHKYLEAWNAWLWDLANAKLLTVYSAGYIDLDKQYLTIGFNGFIEGAEFLKANTSAYDGIDIRPDNEQYKQYAKDVLVTIKELNTAHRTEHLKFNTEQTPCENVGPKFYSWDKRDGYVVPANRNAYNSYFYPVEDPTYDIITKSYLQGTDFIGCLDGGSAFHANLSDYLSKEQYRQIMDIWIKCGCSYGTFNIPNTICNDCEHIDKRYLTECPVCRSKNLDYATRIIGYLKRISNFSEAR